MKSRIYKGQEAVEFILISALVFFASLGVFMLFGDKIGAFFNSDSSAAKAANNKAAIVSGQKYTSPIAQNGSTGAINNLSQPITIQGYNGYLNKDGSMTLNIEGQNVSISSEMLNQANTVFQTTGADGATFLTNEISNLVKTYKDDYPSGSVPINVFYGSGVREIHDVEAGEAVYLGNSSANIVKLAVGDHVVIIQKDQTCQGDCNYPGTYRIEADMSGDTISNAKVDFYQGDSSTPTTTSNTFNGKLITGNDGGKYLSGSYFMPNNQLTYSWNINMNDKQYGI